MRVCANYESIENDEASRLSALRKSVLNEEIEKNHFILDSEAGRHIMKIYADIVCNEYWGDVDHQAYCEECDQYFHAEHSANYAIRTAMFGGNICDTCIKEYTEE